MKNIVLTGFMASGKTVTGKKISELTGMKFVDIDEMIELSENKTINEIFSAFGEEYFRTLEHNAALRCSQMTDCVISCGGGIVLNPSNINLLRQNGIIFNLNPDTNVIKERFQSAAATRPLLKNDNIDGVLKRFEERKTYYNNCDFKIDITCEQSISDIAEKILNIYKTNSGGTL